MKLSVHQLVAILITIVLIIVFYFGCDIQSKDIKSAEKSRSTQMSSTSIDNIKKTTFDSLTPSQGAYYDGLQLQLSEAVYDEDKLTILKELSGFWYQQGAYALAGDVAKQIAEIEESADAWGIAGTTYAAGIKAGKNEKLRRFNQRNAINAFENAISLDPEDPSYSTNLAICYAELPPEDNPMKGIMMLLDLNKKYPENAGVLFQLGRLGIQTGQYEKAIARLENALQLEPNMKKASCLLAIAYDKIGDPAKAAPHIVACEKN